MDRGAWQGTCSPWGRKMLATTERLNHHHRYFWSRKWQLTPVLLPGKSHGWRSLAGCSPWGHKDSDVTEQRSSVQMFTLKFHQSTLGGVCLVASLVRNTK